MIDPDEINTLPQLVRAVSQQRTAGYDVDFEIMPNQERSRAGDGFFLVIKVTDNFPDLDGSLGGEYWFWDDDTIMQVM